MVDLVFFLKQYKWLRSYEVGDNGKNEWNYPKLECLYTCQVLGVGYAVLPHPWQKVKEDPRF